MAPSLVVDYIMNYIEAQRTMEKKTTKFFQKTHNFRPSI